MEDDHKPSRYQRVLVTYIDEQGRRVTICPPAYAEGAERQCAKPKDWLDLGEE